MKYNDELEKAITLRVLRETDAELWPKGPNVRNLLDRFVGAHVSGVNFDSWLPLGGRSAQVVFSWYFQGAALRLADIYAVHERVAMIALAYAALELFPAKNPVDTFKLILSLAKPALDGKNNWESIHMLGAKAVEEWIELGVDSPPSTKYLAQFKELCDRNMTPEAANPGGSADLFYSLISQNPLDRIDKKSKAQANVSANTPEDEWKSLQAQCSALFSDGIDAHESGTEIGEEALALAERAFGVNHLKVAESLALLALLYKRQGMFAEAELAYKRSLKIREQNLDPDDSLVDVCLEGLAKVYYAQGKYADAKPLFQRSLSIKEKMLGSDENMKSFWMGFIKPVRERLAEIDRKLGKPSDV